MAQKNLNEEILQIFSTCLNDFYDWHENDGWSQHHEIPATALLSQMMVSEKAAETTVNTWQDNILKCRRCDLSRSVCRQPITAVFTSAPTLFIVAPPPSYDADQQSQPLSTHAFAYLAKWLQSIAAENNYFLTNLVKCRTPGERRPFANELFRCQQHLKTQLSLFPFRCILALGEQVAQYLSADQRPLAELRQEEFFYENLPLVVTYDPYTVLRNQEKFRRPVWQDLQRLQAYMQKMKDE